MNKIIQNIRSLLLLMLSKSMPKFYYPYKFAGGRIYLDITESNMMLARALGLYEVMKHKAVEAMLHPGDTFIDIGSNKGDFSLLAAKIVGETGSVLAFEPEPENCKWLRKSVGLNGFNNILTFEIALSDKNGVAKLYLGEKSGLHTLIPALKISDRGTMNVRIKTLDNFLKEIKFSRSIDMIKIDVEGAEMEVLRGSSEVLDNNKKLIILMDLHPELGVNPADICDYLTEKGFLIFCETPPFSTPVADISSLTSLIARRI